MAYLIRTFTLNTPSVGSVTSALQEAGGHTDAFDNDTGVTFPQEGSPVLNNGPYSANAAVGYADPLFSLFPVSSDFKKNPDATAEKLVKQFGDYYEGLPKLLKQGSLKDSISYVDDFLKKVAYQYGFGPDDDDWGNFAVAELPEDFPLKEKNKYARLLRNLRAYGPRANSYEYDRPQHALIEAKIDDIQKAKDKIAKYSAESDGPNEFRVSKYVTKGLWTPRHVDTVIKKYFPDYTPGETGSLRDNDRAKDALQEIIQHDADEIISDKRCKDIVRQMNTQLNSSYIDSIVNAIKEFGQ